MTNKFKLDLRESRVVGETYHIHFFSGFMGCSFIYRFNGMNFVRVLHHKNETFYNSFKLELTLKEFKKIVESFTRDEVQWLGIMELD